MRTSSRAAIIFIVLICIAFVCVYLFYEKPAQEQIHNYVNVVIVLKENDINIKTGYSITGEDFAFQKFGETLTGGAILEKIPFNHTYRFNNINLDNQKYYIEQQQLKIIQKITHRIEINLQHAGILNVDSIVEDKNITLILSSDKEYRNVLFCAKWSLNIAKVQFDNKEISKPDAYAIYDKCYSTNQTVSAQDTVAIPFYYLNWNTLDEKDYIKLIFFDSDYVGNQYVYSYDGKDIGGENVDYELNLTNLIY